MCSSDLYSALAFEGDAAAFDNVDLALRCLHQLRAAIPSIKQPEARTLPDSSPAADLSCPKLRKFAERDGAIQLGTLGCGNHFAEIQRDDDGKLWMMIHSGSRGMGQAVSRFHRSRSTPSRTGLMTLDARSDAGRECLSDLDWCVRYASLNRLAMLRSATEIMHELFGFASDDSSYIDSPHNVLRRETHGDATFWVHRKSAASAQANERGLIAGTMASPSFETLGLGNAEALCSSAHGAGRVMSRSEANRKISAAELSRQLGRVHADRSRLAQLRDEAPSAYRDIREVMQIGRAHV